MVRSFVDATVCLLGTLLLSEKTKQLISFLKVMLPPPTLLLLPGYWETEKPLGLEGLGERERGDATVRGAGAVGRGFHCGLPAWLFEAEHMQTKR